jgi:hypothetical protein
MASSRPSENRLQRFITDYEHHATPAKLVKDFNALAAEHRPMAMTRVMTAAREAFSTSDAAEGTRANAAFVALLDAGGRPSKEASSP